MAALPTPHIAGVPCGLPTTAATAISVCMAACLSHIAVVHMWAPHCCRCYPGLHGCLPTPHSWCTLWAPIAAVANIPYMAALPIPHSCCAHVGSLPLLLRLSFLHSYLPIPHSWCNTPIAACSYRHLYGCMHYLSHITVVHMWVPIAAPVRN